MKVTVEIDDFSVKTLYDALLATQFAGCKTYETLFERILNDTVFRLDDFVRNAMKGLILLGYSREDIISRFPGTERKLSDTYDKVAKTIEEKRITEWKEKQQKRREK